MPACGVLSPEVPESLRGGWEIRRRNFGGRISFFAPTLKRFHTSEFRQKHGCLFPPVSITGSRCHLRCDHCGGGILGWMTPAASPRELLETAEDFAGRGAAGMLLSGGSGHDGVVPLARFLGAIGEIRERFGLRIIVHTGITDLSLAQGLAAAGVEAALIDIIGSEAAIRDVCHLDGATPADYEDSLGNLCEAGVAVAPHVVIGLNRGVIDGEHRALKMISRFPVRSLVLVGLSPLRGTPMEGAAPPSPEEMGEIFLEARELMPHALVLLGCERPAGKHKLITDQLALKAGLNGIAYPAEGIIGLAREMGLKPELSELCCAIGMGGSGMERKSEAGSIGTDRAPSGGVHGKEETH